MFSLFFPGTVPLFQFFPFLVLFCPRGPLDLSDAGVSPSGWKALLENHQPGSARSSLPLGQPSTSLSTLSCCFYLRTFSENLFFHVTNAPSSTGSYSQNVVVVYKLYGFHSTLPRFLSSPFSGLSVFPLTRTLPAALPPFSK